METESISKPGLFFTGDLFVFSGDQLEVGDELGSCSPRSHLQAASCDVWAGDGVGKQSETSFQGFIYLLEGERFTGCRFCNAGLMSKTHPEMICCWGRKITARDKVQRRFPHDLPCLVGTSQALNAGGP